MFLIRKPWVVFKFEAFWNTSQEGNLDLVSDCHLSSSMTWKKWGLRPYHILKSCSIFLSSLFPLAFLLAQKFRILSSLSSGLWSFINSRHFISCYQVFNLSFRCLIYNRLVELDILKKTLIKFQTVGGKNTKAHRQTLQRYKLNKHCG